jgi:hypothetical protein
MATFPSYVKVFLGATEQPKSVVLRTEMERGVPKQRRVASDTMVTVPVELMFDTPDDASRFETWVYSQIGGGADWFDWPNPRTGAMVQARIVGGDLGVLKPKRGVWDGVCSRSLTLEYLRSAY